MGAAVGVFRFLIASATKSVIHQKNRLRINQPRKLWPLLFAIEAGSMATNTHSMSKNENQKTLSVQPRIVKSANIVIPRLHSHGTKNVVSRP